MIVVCPKIVGLLHVYWDGITKVLESCLLYPNNEVMYVIQVAPLGAYNPKANGFDYKFEERKRSIPRRYTIEIRLIKEVAGNARLLFLTSLSEYIKIRCGI